MAPIAALPKTSALKSAGIELAGVSTPLSGKIKMSQNSKIEWTDHTFNPWIGCQKVSPGCDHCYAESQNKFRKWNGGTWGPHAPRKRTAQSTWKNPLKWAREASDRGKSARVFCASLADVFDNKASEEAREDLFELIRQTPTLDWLVLTKRPEKIAKLLPVDWGDGYSNVWLGTTAEDQEWYDHRWSILRKIPAKIRFISYEPALGPLRLKPWNVQPDWVICGGESGAGPRYMQPDWARSLRDQCANFGVAFFMKQMTAKATIPEDLLVRQFPIERRMLNECMDRRTMCSAGR
jgi:protein gp37